MQVSVENVGVLGRELTLKIPAQLLHDKVGERIREMSRTMRLRGFRPGRVPEKVVRQRYGKDVRNECLSDLLGSKLQEAFEEKELTPVARPDVDTSGVEDGDEITCVAKFEVMPEFPDIDVSNMAIEKATATVEDADIDEMIENLRQQRRQFKPVERASKETDFVMYDYSADVDGKRVPEEGEERAGAVLGAGTTFAELEKLLVGKKAEDKVSETLDFPEDFRNQELAGKNAKIDITINKIQETSLPELDKDFFSQFGVDSDNVDDFRKEVRENLERELKAALIARLKTNVADQLAATFADLDVPQVLLDNEARALAQSAGQQQEDLDDEALAAHKDEAKKRVTAALLMGEIARKQKLELDQERVGQLMASIAATYQDPQEVIKAYSQDEQMRQALQSRVMEEQVAEWVAEHAATTEKSMSFNDIMRPEEVA